MTCPKCKSENVNIELIQTSGKTKKHGNGVGGHLNNMLRLLVAICTLGLSNLFWKKSKGNETIKMQSEKMALCQSCGHSWKV